MGYMGLKHYGEVDDAFSLAIELQEKIAKVLKKALKEEVNEYNPEGCVNVALVIESSIPMELEVISPELREVIEETYVKLNNLITETKENKPNWEDKKAYKKHLVAYKRMMGNMELLLSAWAE
jgi:EAL domain-containing protein (putative c-di-GMP-specific phosphodiesterase class I)